METRTVECLNCGATRRLIVPTRPNTATECARCGYLGWAEQGGFVEPERRLMRERPVPRRHLHAV